MLLRVRNVHFVCCCYQREEKHSHVPRLDLLYLSDFTALHY